MGMIGCTQKFVRVLVLVLAGLVLLSGLPACSKEEVRRTLPVKRSF